MKNAGELFAQTRAIPFGETYTLKVLRNDEEKEITLSKITRPKVERHLFTLDENAGDEQIELRQTWIRNL